MAEPGVFSGVFPNGILGRRNVKHNRGLIETLGEQILGDEQARADLANMGKLGSVELLLDRGLNAPTRQEQQPVMDALGSIVDGLGLWDRDRIEAGRLDEQINNSIAAAASFVGPEQREELAQLADEGFRAHQVSQYNPTEGMAAYRGITEKLQGLVGEAAGNIRSNFLDPLENMQVETAAAVSQLRQSAGDDLNKLADPVEVLQILNTVGASTAQEFAGAGLSIPFLGGIGPDDVPNMTYSELINTLQSRLNGVADLVQYELDQRGAGVISAAASGDYLPEIRDYNASANNIIDDAIANAEPITGEQAAAAVPAALNGGLNESVTTWLEENAATWDPVTGVVTRADGQRINPPNFVRANLETIQRQRRTRERRMNYER